jgi:putative ABC transport system substrate-binding protein
LRSEYRWAEGRDERAAEIAAEFVRLKADVILATATLAVVAAKQATSVIPIVFAAIASCYLDGADRLTWPLTC